MDQLGNELEKILKAGVGLAQTIAEKTQEGLESLVKKGETGYEQIKTAGGEAIDKFKKSWELGSAHLKDAERQARLEALARELISLNDEEREDLKALIQQFSEEKSNESETGNQEAQDESSDSQQ